MKMSEMDIVEGRARVIRLNQTYRTGSQSHKSLRVMGVVTPQGVQINRTAFLNTVLKETLQENGADYYQTPGHQNPHFLRLKSMSYEYYLRVLRPRLVFLFESWDIKVKDVYDDPMEGIVHVYLRVDFEGRYDGID